MSYRLGTDEAITAGIRRIISEQVDKALHSLTESDETFEEGIHDARKRFKKVRAVPRLVRDAIGDERYHAENKNYRNAGRLLSNVRESTVAIETLDTIVEHYNEELDDGGFADVRERLCKRHERIVDFALERKQVNDVVIEITEAHKRINTLPTIKDEFASLSDGLHRVYKRGYKGITHAYDNPTPENFHEWRKRVKYLWYHMRILKPVWSDVQDEFADAVHLLADYLGDANDFADFENLIRDHPELFVDEETAGVLAALSRQRRIELNTTAHTLGQRIYAEKPDAFVARMFTYWRAMKAEVLQIDKIPVSL